MPGPTKEQQSRELCISAKKHLNAIKAISVNPKGSQHYKPPLQEIERLKIKIQKLESLWSDGSAKSN